MAKMTYSQVEGALFNYLQIHPERQKTFSARLKQWQKMGFPHGTNVGKGRRAEYGAAEYFQLAFLGDLLMNGLTPERGIQLINRLWARISHAIYDTLICRAGRANHAHYLAVRVNILYGFRKPSDRSWATTAIADALHLNTLGFFVRGYTSRDIDLIGSRGITLDKSDNHTAYLRGYPGRGEIVFNMDWFVSFALYSMQQQGVALSDFRDEILDTWPKVWIEGASFFHMPPEASPESDSRTEYEKAVGSAADSLVDDVLGLRPEEARSRAPDAEGNHINPRWHERFEHELEGAINEVIASHSGPQDLVDAGV